MKILHLIYSQQVAGAEKYLMDLLPDMKKKGIDCSLIYVIPPADQYKFTEVVKILNEQGVPTTVIAGSSKGLFKVAKQIAAHLKANGIRHMHAHLFKADILAVLVKKFFYRKVQLLSTKHGYQESYLNKHLPQPGKIEYNPYYFISKYINANIDAQVTISKAMSELYYNLKLTKTRIPFIHHGTDIVTPAIAAQYRKAPQQLVVVGRVEMIKGHKYLLNALPAVLEKFPAVKLLVLGNGTEKENLQQQAKELGIETAVEFLGFQSNPADWVSNSDVIVLPSLFEPFGLVYIESFALKTPVVAFDVQATNEIIQHNETGLLAPVFDAAALAQHIIHLLQNPEERIRLAGNAHTRYATHFTKERMVNETIAWYQEVGAG